MNQTPQFPISDELLSAYIDGDVTDAEKQQIEFAIANDPEIAWQVETLRQTVTLLRDLPVIPAPRSFVLEEAQVADVLAARREERVSHNRTTAASRSAWQRLLAFFSSGNLALRNASAIAAALFVVVTMSRAYLAQGPIMPMADQPEQATMIKMATAPAEPAAGESDSEQSREAAPAALKAPEPLATPVSSGQDAGAAAEPEVQTTALRTAPSAETAREESPVPELATVSLEVTSADTAENAAEGDAARVMPFSQEAADAEQAPGEIEPFSAAASTIDEDTANVESAESSVAEASVVPREAPPAEPAPIREAADEETSTAGITVAQVAIPTSEENAAVTETDAVTEDAEAEVVEEATPVADAVAEDAEAEMAEEDSVADDAGVEAVEEEAAVEEVPEATLAPEAAPEADTVAVEKPGDPSASELVVEEGADPAVPGTSPVSDGTSNWNVWQTMQVGLLSLTLILLLLWLGSRRRVSG